MMTCKSLNNGHVGNSHFPLQRGCPLSEVILYSVILDCPLNGDLSSFGVSFIRGSTVSNNKSIVILLFAARYTIAYSRILQMKSS